MTNEMPESTRVSAQSRLSEAFASRHAEDVEEAEKRGEADGNHNLPSLEDSFKTPYEKKLQSKYQGEISRLFREGSQWLQDIYDQQVQSIRSQLRDIVDDPEFIKQKVDAATENRDRLLKEADHNLVDKLQEIENEPSWVQVDREFT